MLLASSFNDVVFFWELKVIKSRYESDAYVNVQINYDSSYGYKLYFLYRQRHRPSNAKISACVKVVSIKG